MSFSVICFCFAQSVHNNTCVLVNSDDKCTKIFVYTVVGLKQLVCRKNCDST